MSHDPENYHDPFAFKPERFLRENGRKPELDPRTIAFGFGRRLCNFVLSLRTQIDFSTGRGP